MDDYLQIGLLSVAAYPAMWLLSIDPKLSAHVIMPGGDIVGAERASLPAPPYFLPVALLWTALLGMALLAAQGGVCPADGPDGWVGISGTAVAILVVGKLVWGPGAMTANVHRMGLDGRVERGFVMRVIDVGRAVLVNNVIAVVWKLAVAFPLAGIGMAWQWASGHEVSFAAAYEMSLLAIWTVTYLSRASMYWETLKSYEAFIGDPEQPEPAKAIARSMLRHRTPPFVQYLVLLAACAPWLVALLLILSGCGWSEGELPALGTFAWSVAGPMAVDVLLVAMAALSARR